MSSTDTLAGAVPPRLAPYRLGRGRRFFPSEHDATGHGEGGPASKDVVVGYGFWIFILSDIVMFSAFFAAHAVLQSATAGGRSGHDRVDPPSIVIETSCL